MNSQKSILRLFLAAAFVVCGIAPTAADEPPLHCYISTGDNQWLGQSLPIDSPASIEASFDLLHRLGVKRVYWRGLEAATWVEGHRERPESVRYYEFWKWLRRLYENVEPDRLAVEAAHKHGMEIWGVGNLVDWGASADTPPFKHYPFNSESRLRIDNPEWVPTDKSGLLKQGGPVELAYPEARRALIDLHMKFMKEDGYDGMTFLTYAENHSMRFQHEFGYNQPIVDEFKRRHRLDIRYEDWTRFATPDDWQLLRGQFVTQFLRELKMELDASDQKLGFFLQPWDPHKPQPWNVPELLLTGGSMHFDLETWIADGLVDDFLVYGYANPEMQVRAVRNMRWMTRDTPVNVGILTSGPSAERWKPFQAEGVPTVIAYGEDAMYLDRSFQPEQPMTSLQSDDPLLAMKALSQIVHEKSKASFDEVSPLVDHEHLIVRRLALQALGKIGGPEAVEILEKALFDPENSIRCMAGVALRDAHGPDTAARILESIELHGNHMLAEIMRVTLPRIQPLPRDEMVEAYRNSDSVRVRQMAMRALIFMPDASLIPVWSEALDDPDRFTRVAAVRGLGRLGNNSEASRQLLANVTHDDPVMANEACVALGEGLARSAEILAALEARYAQFGDGYDEVDHDWGYRPVGNALLAFGAEGEAVLQGFIDQTSDRQLAINAWKSLYIRQRAGSFSEVTEKEHAEAMRHRPLFLKKPVTPRLRQDFEDKNFWSPETRGMIGDVNTVAGRWGELLEDGPDIASTESGQALRIRRGGASFTGQAVPEVADEADYQLSFSLYRQTEDSALVVQLRGLVGQTFQNELALNVGESGALRFMDSESETWIESGLIVQPKVWTKVRLIANRRARKFSIAVQVKDDESEILAESPGALNVRSKLRNIVLIPQPPEDSEVLVDEIELTEIR